VAQLGVSRDRVVAFGDSDNDIPLLREAAFAVQVGAHACLTGHAHTQLARQEDLEGYLRGLCAWLEDSATPVLASTQMA
jgi:phosphoserine phosphatase